VSRKILVADDSHNIRSVLQLNLEWKGYEVLSAADGEEAVRIAERVRPDLIILDVMMPRRNGFQVCRLFKNDAKTSDIPVILLTAKSQAEDRYWGRDCGADEYITKPFNTPALEQAVERLLRQSDDSEDASESPEGRALQGALERTIRHDQSCGVCYLRLEPRPLLVHRQKYGELAHQHLLEVVQDAIGAVLREEGQDPVIEPDDGCFRVLLTAAGQRVRAVQQRLTERCNQAVIQCYDPEDRERGFVLSRDPRTREELHVPLVTLQVERTLLYNQD
jgi:DNA-binding response OmpR family regulator